MQLSIKKSQKLHFQLTLIPFQCWLLEMWYSKSMCSHYSVYRRYATNFQAVDLSVFLANDSLITCKVKRIWDLLQCLRMCIRLLHKVCLKIIELTFCLSKIERFDLTKHFEDPIFISINSEYTANIYITDNIYLVVKYLLNQKIDWITVMIKKSEEILLHAFFFYFTYHFCIIMVIRISIFPKDTHCNRKQKTKQSLGSSQWIQLDEIKFVFCCHIRFHYKSVIKESNAYNIVVHTINWIIVISK